MKKEFNPTKQDLLMVESLLLNLKNKKNELVTRKINIQNSLSSCHDKYKNTDFNGREFLKIKEQRVKLKSIFNEIELELRKVNEEINFKRKLQLEIQFFLKNNNTLETSEDLNKLDIKIKDLIKKYKSFAKDRTRISSLRVMASEIVEELENLHK